jgi:lipoprotein-anchoring transpeptidase ErfK/SrfK
VWKDGAIVLTTEISSGRASKPTPPGDYLVTDKYRDWKSTIYPARMPYFMRLSCGNFGLHAGSLPGYPASHGCVRLPAENAKKLFALLPIGTEVVIR